MGKLSPLRPEHREEYLRLHAAVWPGVEAALAAGFRNYSIFLHGDLLFSYSEYIGEDLEADMARLAAEPETQRRWSLTDPCQQRLPGTPARAQWMRLPEVWHLDEPPVI